VGTVEFLVFEKLADAKAVEMQDPHGPTQLLYDCVESEISSSVVHSQHLRKR